MTRDDDNIDFAKPLEDDGLKLEPDELRSSTWLKIQAHYQKRLEAYRKKNDGNLQPDETTRLRGRIAEVKDLLALAEVTED